MIIFNILRAHEIFPIFWHFEFEKKYFHKLALFGLGIFKIRFFWQSMEQIMSDFETFRSKMSVPKFIKFLSTRIILELNLELIPSSWFNPIWDNHDFHFERWTKTISFHRNITPYGQSDLSKLIILGQIHKYSWIFSNVWPPLVECRLI